MTTEELTEQQRRHNIEITVSAIAWTLASTPEWDADTLDTIAELIGEVTTHPGDITPGTIPEYADEENPPGGYENYLTDLMQSGLPVSYAMLAEAQEADREANAENEQDDTTGPALTYSPETGEYTHHTHQEH